MRAGAFTRVTHDYGASLSIVKPPDNNFGKPYPPELDDLELTDAEREELTQRIEDLLASYQAEREYYGS